MMPEPSQSAVPLTVSGLSTKVKALHREADLWVGMLLLLVGLALLVRPGLLAGRFQQDYVAAVFVARGIGTACLPIGLCVALWKRLAMSRLFLQCATAGAAYLALSAVFLEWHVDDAAITYAYSENLASGNGLVLHPNHDRQEGYSSTLWMLLLAASRSAGFDVAASSKLLGAGIGVTVPLLVVMLLARIRGQALGGSAFAVVLGTLLSAPYVIWSSSGLEHGLQAALLLALVWGSVTEKVSTGALTLFGSALVLTRPEAPLVVAALVAYLAAEAWAPRRRLRDALPLWPIAVIPAVTLVALLVFRRSYFGDLWPNPYYAKAQEATFLRLVNPFGTGWRYVTEWLAQGGGFMPLAILFALRARELPRQVRPALAVLFGQLSFVLYAGGDWMGLWRFLAAPIVILALLAGNAMQAVAAITPAVASRYAAFVVGALVLCNVPLLVGFRARPTTPYLTVAEIGRQFVALANRLDIEDPTLAHHDAGGTSYRAKIDLLDLGGLGSRVIAKHLDDPEFLRRYILDEKKPDFVFGVAGGFAAGVSRFHDTPTFERDYVPVVFEGVDVMKSDLCHMRRAHVRELPGIVVTYEDGTAASVTVRPVPL